MSSPYLSEQLRTPRQQAADTLVSRLQHVGGTVTGRRWSRDDLHLYVRFASRRRELVRNAIGMACDGLPFEFKEVSAEDIGYVPLYEVKLRWVAKP